MGRESRITTIGRRLTQAKRLLASARDRLAGATASGDAPAVFDPQWRWAHELLQRRAPALRAIKGVVGYSVAYRWRAGMPTQEPCIVVYVREKRPLAQLKKLRIRALPRYLGEKGRRIGVDVVQLGELRRQAFTGQLFMGNSLGRSVAPNLGTLGGRARNLNDGQIVAITAMHVSGLDELPAPGQRAIEVTSPSRTSDLRAPAFGNIVKGSMQGVDACKIAVAAGVTLEPRMLGIGRIRGWRPVVVPSDHNTSVRLYGAVSGLQSGVIDTPYVSLPEYDLDGAILVSISTTDGDSGAALVDSQNLILGFLVGRAGAEHGHLAVFCPAAMVLRRLECDIPTETTS